MSAHCSLRSCSPLKALLGKLGDTYQAYNHTYETKHAMATHHGGLGLSLDRDIDVTREAHETMDTDFENTKDFHPVGKDHFEDLQHKNPEKLKLSSEK